MLNRSRWTAGRVVAFTLTSMLAPCIASPVFAQEAAAADEQPAYGEIIVTAQKRAETLIAVPATISAFDTAMLERTNARTLENLALMVPGVQFSTAEGKGQASIRGIGNQFIIGASEAAVATHVDGFYVARPSGIIGSFLDVERVEVLKGPQGTLYGRNATSGTINIITNKPTDELSMRLSVEGFMIDRGGDAGTGYGLRASAVGNVPISDRINARLAVMKVNRDGYMRAFYPNGDKIDVQDADEIYVRGQLSIDVSDRINWLLATDNYWADDRGAFINMVGPVNPDVPIRGVQLGFQNAGRQFKVFLDRPISNTPKQNAFTSTLTWDASDTVTVKSLTQYRYNRYHTSGEFDSTWAPISENDYHIISKEITQEFQFNLDLDRFRATSGLFYFQEKINLAQYFFLPETARPAVSDLFLNGRGTTKAYAAFADLMYKVTDQLEITLGGRYSIEDRTSDPDARFEIRTGDPNAPFVAAASLDPLPKRRFKAFTPKGVINYRPSDDITLFVSAQKGFKSGGYNLGSLERTSFAPEKIRALEIGAKTRFLDRKVGVNISAFTYKYTDLQVENTRDFETLIQNAAAAKIKGIEVDGYVRPISPLRLDFNASILDAKFSEGELVNPVFPLDEVGQLNPVSIVGNRLFRSSKYSGTLGITYDYEWPSGSVLSPNFTASYRSKQYFTAFNEELASQKGYWWLRASLTFRPAGSRWSAMLFGDNLTNEFVLTSGTPSAIPYGSPLQAGNLPPRTFGVKFDYDF